MQTNTTSKLPSVILAIPATLTVALRTIVFQTQPGMLPNKVRAASTGFICLLSTFILAAFLRHCIVGNLGVLEASVQLIITLALVFRILGDARLVEVSIYLAASVGIDLVFTWLTQIGLDQTWLPFLSFGWEISATACAILKLRAYRLAQPPVEYDQEGNP